MPEGLRRALYSSRMVTRLTTVTLRWTTRVVVVRQSNYWIAMMSSRVRAMNILGKKFGEMMRWITLQPLMGARSVSTI